MKIKVLASGSKGNCTYLELEDKKILIDIGISYKKLRASLEDINVCPTSITHVFITHEHTDHTSGIGVFYKLSKSNAMLYMTMGTLHELMVSSNEGIVNVLDKLVLEDKLKVLRAGNNLYEEITLDNVVINTIPAFHDAKEPVGFVFNYLDKKLVYLTDTGYVHNKLFSLIENATCYIIETNHDIEMLMNSERPYKLKQRILSQHGHLSNEDSLVTLAKLIGMKTKHVIHAHISSDCNCVNVIKDERRRIFDSLDVIYSDISFEEVPQDYCSECIDL